MAAAAGIFNQQQAAQALTGRAAPMADSSSGTGGTGSSSDSSSTSATISSNDFLTLLVTEMQNQDPTSQTDPNEYINQLVEVNSLEQLISINQTLTGALGTSSSTPASGQGASTPAAEATPDQTVAVSGAHVPAGTAANPLTASAPGNLSIPAANSAAQRVAHALDGRIDADKLPSQIR